MSETTVLETPAQTVLMPSQMLLARRVAADAFEATGGKGESRKKFDAAVLKDPRLDNCTKEEIDAIAAASGECFAYWKAAGIEKPTADVGPVPESPIVVSGPESESV